MFLDEMYAVRENLTKEIVSKLVTNRKLLLTGEPGSGKSTLLEIMRLHGDLRNRYEIIHEFTGTELEISKGAKITTPKRNSGKLALMIIDGFEEMKSSEVKEKLFAFYQQSKEYVLDFFFVTRSSESAQQYLNDFVVIETPMLTFDDVEDLRSTKGVYYKPIPPNLSMEEDIKARFGRTDRATLIEVEKHTRNNAYLVSLLFDLMKTGLDMETAGALLKKDLTYANDLLKNHDSRAHLIIPSIPKLITDVRVINQSLIDKVKKIPRGIYGISSREFEELVAELFEKEGYNVTMTKQTHDGGKDLVLVENRKVGKFIYYVECKRNSITHPVGVNVVRELYGGVMADRVTAGIVVTSSYFSEPAKEYTEKIVHQMSLIDYVDLHNWMNEASRSK